MKKLSIILCLLIFCGQVVFANQDNNVEDNKFTAVLQKGGEADNAEQKQEIKNNRFCIIMQINGKFKDSNNSDK